MCRVSVIVPTHNRAASLPENLDRVLNQTYSDYEAIYVNDSSSDDTTRILDEYAARAPNRLRVVTVECGAPGPARNAGAAIARGESLLFTDDDVRVPHDWVARMVASHESNRCAALCGGIAPVSADTDVERYLHFRVVGALGKKARRINAAPMMNFLVTRDAFQNVSGFLDAPLRAAEDWDFCHRLLDAGHAIHFDPAIEVAHAYQRELIPASHRMRDAGAAGVYIWLRRRRGAFLYTAYAMIRCVLSPFWVPFRYAFDLYALAVHMEYIFAEARLLAYIRYLRGRPIL